MLLERIPGTQVKARTLHLSGLSSKQPKGFCSASVQLTWAINE